jgi:hypothetical protein
MCKSCHAAYMKCNYSENHAARRATYRKRIDDRRQWLYEYLEGKRCCDCGEDDIIVLTFDHRDPKGKVESISVMNKRASEADLLLEMAKCDIVCSNCHTRRTAKMFGWRKARHAAQ